jgi:phage terminase large subunit
MIAANDWILGRAYEPLTKWALSIRQPEHAVREVCLSGPAGTGKTIAALQTIHALCETGAWPGMRVLIGRKTRKSLTESVLASFENKVVQRGHPVLRGPARNNRSKYVYPKGAEIILGGFDDPTRLFSTEFDLIYIAEAIELTLDEYQSLYRAIRNTGWAGKLILTDTNPGPATHFLRQKALDPDARLYMIETTHRDNPFFFDRTTGRYTPAGRAYLGNLGELTGVMRKRLLEGIWCAAEGAIYPMWSEEHHLVFAGRRTKDKPFGERLPDFAFTVGSLDLGFRDATVLQIWGVTRDRKMYRIHERYGTFVPLDKLAEWVDYAYCFYMPTWIDADHRPEVIDFLNQRLGVRRGRKVGSVVRPAKKGPDSIQAGIDAVATMMGDPMNGVESDLYLVRDAALPFDTTLANRRVACCTEHEIPGYVWDKTEDGKPIKDRPLPGQYDHGCDAMRYAVASVFRSNYMPQYDLLDRIRWRDRASRESEFMAMVEADN